MRALGDFFGALGFLTILPCPKRFASIDDYSRICGWFPIVGAVLGGILHLVARFLFFAVLSPLAAAASVTVLWAILTRGLHLDGLADTFDGIGGGYDRESRLAIMKDSRLGTFGGIAIASVLLLKSSLLSGLGGHLQALWLAPVTGRWSMIIAMRFFPPARPGGMGDTFRALCRWHQLILASLAALWAVLLLGGLRGLPLLVIVPALVYLLSRWLCRMLGGLTGDSYGALCEITELATLVFFAAL